MSDIEARAQLILSTTGLRTSQVDSMLEEVEAALTVADDKLIRVRKAVADIPETFETRRAVAAADTAATHLHDSHSRLVAKRERLVADAQEYWASFASHLARFG